MPFKALGLDIFEKSGGGIEGGAVSKHEAQAPLIFVVDDDLTTTRLVEEILQHAGFATMGAGDFASGLAGIQEHRPEMVLLDVSLPDGSGFDLCRMLQADSATSRIPVLFISGHDDISSKVRGFEVGGVDYLTKPVARAEVLARVRTHLRLKRAVDQLAILQAEKVQRLAVTQRNMMPNPEDYPEARFAARVRQIQAAGGDFYDVVPVTPVITDYLVADASGHDLSASLWTAALKALVAEYATPVNLPEGIVQALNGTLCRLMADGSFFTLIYARLNRKNGRLSVINAGHPPAIIVHADERPPTVLEQSGDVLGAFSDGIFDATEVIMKPGDRLFMYTDGLIELGGESREEGLDALTKLCFSSRNLPLAQQVPATFQQATSNVDISDDIVLLGVER